MPRSGGSERRASEPRVLAGFGWVGREERWRGNVRAKGEVFVV